MYTLKPDRNGWETNNEHYINASHVCSLPGVHCPDCNKKWASSATIYPSIECNQLLELKNYLKPSNVPLSVYIQLVRCVREKLGDDNIILNPGTEFGPLHGSAWGNFGDFTWQNPWTVLVREKIFKILINDGIKLIGIRSQLKFNKMNSEPLFELEAKLGAELHKSILDTYGKPCETCGRLGVIAPELIIIDKNTLNNEIPIQRIKSLTTYLIVNEEFASYIKDYGFTDVILREIEVA